MSSTPQKRAGASTLFGGSPSKKVLLKGLFDDGVWLCNCSPRLPASHFHVKKEGPNKGRWFYTCQESKNTGCGFFMWDEEAKPREMRAVIGNSRSEIVEGEDTRKRTDDEEFLGWGEHSLEGEKKAEGRKVGEREYPETPRKESRTEMFTTPGSKRKREREVGGLPTPVTGTAVGNKFINIGAGGYGHNDEDDVFSTQSSLPTPTDSHFGPRSPSNTPTPTRFLPSTTKPPITLETPTSHHSAINEYDITPQILTLLQPENLSEETTEKLKEVLSKHALRISGIARGRDITRVALRAKEGKISELVERVAEVERQREVDKTIIRHFKSDMANSLEKYGKG